MLKEIEQYPPVYKIAAKFDGKQYWLEWFCRENDYTGKHYFEFMLDTGRKDDLEYLSQKEVYTLEGLQEVMLHAKLTSQEVFVPDIKKDVRLKEVELTPVTVMQFIPVKL